MYSMRTLIATRDYNGIKKALEQDPSLANEGIPFDEKNTAKAHPLHRICDGVFNNIFSDEEAIEMAKIFLSFGANINGNEFAEKKDTPLIAAASLHAEKTGIFYVDQGADIHHAGCHGGTALHWAAWVGKDKLVKRLLQENPEINKRCIDFKSTPLFWAIHGYKHGGGKNTESYTSCVRLLLEAGADNTIPNIDGKQPIEILDEDDVELKELLN